MIDIFFVSEANDSLASDQNHKHNVSKLTERSVPWEVFCRRHEPDAWWVGGRHWMNVSWDSRLLNR